MSNWIIKKSIDDDSYFLLEKGNITIWFQKVRIDNDYIKFYDRDVLTECYHKKAIPQYIIDELENIPKFHLE